MTNYTITGSANLADDGQAFLGQWEVQFPSTTTTAVDGDGSWRGGVQYFDVDRDTGSCDVTLPGTTGDQMYRARFVPKDKRLKSLGPFDFTLTEATTWADIMTIPSTPPVPWTAEDTFVAGLFSTETATRDAVDARYQQQTTGNHSIYVDPAGSDSNDGLTALTPFATFQAAFDYLDSLGPILQGNWEVVAAAGTYSGHFDQTLSTRSVNRIVVRGPAVSGGTPTAIIDGTGGGDYVHGLRASGIGVRVEFRDLKFINFSGDPSGNTRIGCVGENESDFETTNVHTTGCTWVGIYAFNCVRARINGGTHDGNRQGLAYNSSAGTIDGATVKNSTEVGVYWSRGSQGHVDNCVLDSNPIGLRVAENSRVDTVANNIKKNNVGIRTMTGGEFIEGGTPNTMNSGTADANTTDVEYKAYSGKQPELETGTTPVRVAYDRTARTVTGVTVATNLVPTVYTIPAYRLQGVGKGCRIVLYGIYTMTAGSTFSVKIGTNTLTMTVPAAATALPFKIEAELLEVNGGYRCFGSIIQGLNNVRMGQASGFTNTAAAAVTVDVTPANAADTVTIYRTDFFLVG